MAVFDGKDTIILSDDKLNMDFCGNDLDNTGERMKDVLANQFKLEQEEPDNPWKNLQMTDGKYYIAKGDEEILNDCNKAIRKKNNSKNYLFHPEILPEPFWGDIKKANVLILSGNPGLGKAERNFNKNETFVDVTLKNISLDEPKIVWLDQECKKDIVFNDKPHPGFEYWEKRTRVLREAAGENLNICIIEYFPYHSKKISSIMKKKGKDLRSCEFVDFYIKQAIGAGKWIVIARCKFEWLDRIKELEEYSKNSGRVLKTRSQQMYLTPRNLQRIEGSDSLAVETSTWQNFVKHVNYNYKII